MSTSALVAEKVWNDIESTHSGLIILLLQLLLYFRFIYD